MSMLSMMDHWYHTPAFIPDADTSTPDNIKMAHAYWTGQRLTSTLSELASSRDARELTLLLNSIRADLDLSLSHYAHTWRASFPPSLLEVISDEAWYHQLAAEIKELEPSVLSESSMSTLVFLQAAVVRLDELIVSARDLMYDPDLVLEMKRALQSMPLFFDRLWRYRDNVFRATRPDSIGGKTKSMLSDMQPLLQNYFYLYRVVYPSSSDPPLTFAAHISFYCWYNATADERGSYGLPAYISLMLGKSTMRECQAFMRETVNPILGPIPADAISRILTTDESLTQTVFLRITVDLILKVISLEPWSIVRDARDGRTFMMALATAAQRHICQWPGPEDLAHPQYLFQQRSEQTSILIFQIIWITKIRLGGDGLRQIIVKHLNYLNFLPHIARCIALAAYDEEYFTAMNSIMFLIDIFGKIGVLKQRGHLTPAQLAEYRNFRRILQVHWRPVLNELQSESSMTLFPQANPRSNPFRKLRMARTQWQRLGDVYEFGGEQEETFWSEREMLGCFNVDCSCYGQKPLHKLGGKCSRCQVAQYCSHECQKRDWKARHKAICSSS